VAAEATARIKINKLLEAAGWRFFADGGKPANIQLEPSITLKQSDIDALGNNFEQTSKGFIDFLLLDAKGFPLIVLEAKSEDKNPLVGKEQARKYAKSQQCRFVILSNGNLHYFWDLERGNPEVITSFPTPDSVTGYKKIAPDSQKLVAEAVNDDYIVLTQKPNYQFEAAWKNESERAHYIQANKLRFLRPYLFLPGPFFHGGCPVGIGIQQDCDTVILNIVYLPSGPFDHVTGPLAVGIADLDAQATSTRHIESFGMSQKSFLHCALTNDQQGTLSFPDTHKNLF